MKVSNMTSPRDNPVDTQVVIDYGERVVFKSYNTTIVEIQKASGITYLDERYWNYSRTTGRYRNQFLGETIRETQAKINNGEYVLTNLN